ncbi:MAG: hypothetical protein ACKV2T_41080 [Kofleriaceae bacterium]
MRASIVLFASLVLISIVALRSAEACSCSTYSLEKSIANADLVFWGEITASKTIQRPVTGWRYTVTVKGVWKGDVKVKTFVVTDNSSCGLKNVGARVGAQLLFAVRQGDTLFARQCSGSRKSTPEVREEATKIAGAERAPS